MKRIILLGLFVGLVLLPQCVDVDSLHDAAKEGDIRKIRRLLKSGTDVNLSEDTGWTALHWAVHNKHKDVVELLISSGASVNVRSRDSRTPLHIAAEFGPRDIAELLIAAGADIEAVDSAHRATPLHWAAYVGQKAVAELLIAKGANIEAVNIYGDTPLDNAVMNRHEDIAELLRQHGAHE